MKFATIAIIGNTNAGKSSLFNSFMPKPYAAVTHKINTTITPHYGIAAIEGYQLLLVDTPGLEHTIRNDAMKKMIIQIVKDADLVWHVVDSPQASHAYQTIDALLKHCSAPSILLLNKVDRMLGREQILQQLASLSDTTAYTTVLPFSTKKKKHHLQLLDETTHLLELMELHPAEEFEHTQNKESLCLLLAREQLLVHLHQEVPYQLHQRIEYFKETSSQILITIQIYVSRPQLRGMVLGKHGATIARIRQAYNRRLEAVFNKKVIARFKIKNDKKRA